MAFLGGVGWVGRGGPLLGFRHVYAILLSSGLSDLFWALDHTTVSSTPCDGSLEALAGNIYIYICIYDAKEVS